MLEYIAPPKRKSKALPIDVSSEIYQKSMKLIYRDINLQNKNEKKVAEYQSVLLDYQAQCSCSIPSFLFPQNILSFFYCYNNSLYYQNKKVTSGSTFFKQLNLPTTISGQVEQKIIEYIHKFISELYTSLGSALTYYHNFYYSGPDSILLNFYDCFKLYQDNLFFISPDNRVIALTADNVSQLFEAVNQPEPPSKFSRKLYKLIRDALLQTEGNFRIKITPTSKIHTLTFFEKPDKYIDLTYDPERQTYMERCYKLPDKDEQLLLPHATPLPPFSTAQEKLSKAFAALTHLDITLFNKLAMMCACIASPELLEKKLFVISGPQNIMELITVLFIDPLQKVPYAIPLSFKELISAKNIVPYSSFPYKGYKCFVITDCTPLTKENDIKTFKKIIRGQKITGTDKVFGKTSFTNTFPIICFPKTHKELISMTNLYPSIVLDFSDASPQDLSILHQYQNWIRLPFVLYGLKLIADSKNGTVLPRNKKIPVKLKHDEIINEFIQTCCTKNKKKFTYAENLYEAYLKFFAGKYGSTQPLKRSQFVTQLKISGDYEYKRPHVNRNEPNKWAFTGIVLKEDFLDRISNTEYSLEEKEFHKKMLEIDELVPITLYY